MQKLYQYKPGFDGCGRFGKAVEFAPGGSVIIRATQQSLVGKVTIETFQTPPAHLYYYEGKYIYIFFFYISCISSPFTLFNVK